MLKLETPASGWKQFLGSRKQMLDRFDAAKTQSQGHPVETWHGKVAEAQFREWLAAFLPKKYAVTSGYVISVGIPDSEKLLHFDVIIYEHLESPVLWIEGSADQSDQGRSLAIPVEHVKAVYEVKSTFNPKNVRDAINHLGDLEQLLKGVDLPNDRFKKYLPPDFICGTVFFDLNRQFQYSKASLNAFTQGFRLRGFSGGMILRGEGHELPETARILLQYYQEEKKSNIKRPQYSLLMSISTHSDTIKIAAERHVQSRLWWSETHFSLFAFSLIANLKGIKDNLYPSFYGFGSSQIERTKS